MFREKGPIYNFIRKSLKLTQLVIWRYKTKFIYSYRTPKQVCLKKSEQGTPQNIRKQSQKVRSLRTSGKCPVITLEGDSRNMHSSTVPLRLQWAMECSSIVTEKRNTFRLLQIQLTKSMILNMYYWLDRSVPGYNCSLHKSWELDSRLRPTIWWTLQKKSLKRGAA